MIRFILLGTLSLTCLWSEVLHFNLQEAIDYALEKNPSIRQQKLELEKSEFKVTEAISGFYPNINLSTSYGYISEIPVFEMQLDPTQPAAPIPMGRHANYAIRIGFQQPLFTWGKLYQGYKMADIGREMTKLELERKRQEVRYNVCKTFYGLILAERMVELTKESLERMKHHKEVTEKRYKAGMAPHFELLRADVEVANLKPQVIKAESGLKLAKEGFKLVLGVSSDAEIEIEGELVYPEEDFKLASCIQEAMENRAELKNLRKAKEIAQRALYIARTYNLPSIFGSLNYEYKRPFQFAKDEWGSSLTFGIGMSLPLFTGFESRAQVHQAEADLKKINLGVEDLQKAINLEVREAYLSLEGAKETVESSKKVVGQAEEALRIIETRYKNGQATNLEVFDTQLALMQAKTNLVTALKDYNESISRLIKAMGRK